MFGKPFDDLLMGSSPEGEIQFNQREVIFDEDHAEIFYQCINTDYKDTFVSVKMDSAGNVYEGNQKLLEKNQEKGISFNLEDITKTRYN